MLPGVDARVERAEVDPIEAARHLLDRAARVGDQQVVVLPEQVLLGRALRRCRGFVRVLAQEREGAVRGGSPWRQPRSSLRALRAVVESWSVATTAEPDWQVSSFEGAYEHWTTKADL